MRLDKLLSNMGYGSRKEVKLLLKSKAVEVNGAVAKDVSMHVDTEYLNNRFSMNVLHHSLHD